MPAIESTHLPRVTIILPIRNEALFIASTLASVVEQDYPAEKLEVFVADGMSTDGTREIVAGFQEQVPYLKMLDNPGQIVPTGLNAAIRQASGEVILRVDGHTLIERDYVRQCVAALERSNADNVGGRMAAAGKTSFGGAVALATSTPFGIGGARFHYSDQEEWVDTVYLGAWPRRVFERVGLFDEELVRDQDDEFNYRLRKAGGKILLSPLIKSRYFVRSRPGALWRQYTQYGFWKVRVLQKHPRQMRPRQFAPPMFVAALLLTGLSAPFLWFSFWLFLALTGVYMLANLAASISTAAKHNAWRILPWLALTYAILHIGYGTGFLAGLLRFSRRWKDRLGQAPAYQYKGREHG
ncbi:MAG: glycosyltransferase family 2 protein [Chloroflexota bacterium]